MKFVSTRSHSNRIGVDEALLSGLAADGGLFVPEKLTKIDTEALSKKNIATFAAELLAVFFDESSVRAQLKEICETAFSFEIPMKRLNKHISVLELTHGPTCAFKDVGAQFLAATISKLNTESDLPKTVLVATSGDTGGAVGCAFSGRNDTRVVILYPNGRISDRQERQLTCWQSNVTAYAVEGSFDDCQKMVKEAFSDKALRHQLQLLSANSISLGRLLPQMVYYAYTSAQSKTPVNFIIPTGNLGNAIAAIWAKRLGFKINKIGLALNANRAIADFLTTREWNPHETIATLANAMDVGNASNIERLRDLFAADENALADVYATSASDDQIRQAIKDVYQDFQYIACPHTATAFYAQSQLKWPDAIVVATADPAKFNEIIEPLINRPIETPPALEAILGKKFNRNIIGPNYEELRGILLPNNS